MRRFILAILAAGWATLVSFGANAGGWECGSPAGIGCRSAAPVVTVYPRPVPATMECEVRDLVNQGQFYSTAPLLVQRTCRFRCPPQPEVPEPLPAVPTCWR
jgi:hypothetical protein